jgi:hypothetical protein
LTLISQTSGGRSAGIVRSRTQATESGQFSQYSDGMEDPGSVPDRARLISFLQRFDHWAHEALPSGVKQHKREPDHSALSTAEVDKVGAILPHRL